MNRRTRALEFSTSERRKIKDRDGGRCIFCRIYGNSGFEATQIMHFIPRSHGGLGVEQNGALGCVVHHQQLDNSPARKVMLEEFKAYLMNCYGENWSPDDYVFRRW